MCRKRFLFYFMLRVYEVYSDLRKICGWRFLENEECFGLGVKSIEF